MPPTHVTSEGQVVSSVSGTKNYHVVLSQPSGGYATWFVPAGQGISSLEDWNALPSELLTNLGTGVIFMSNVFVASVGSFVYTGPGYEISSGVKLPGSLTFPPSLIATEGGYAATLTYYDFVGNVYDGSTLGGTGPFFLEETGDGGGGGGDGPSNEHIFACFYVPDIGGTEEDFVNLFIPTATNVTTHLLSTQPYFVNNGPGVTYTSNLEALGEDIMPPSPPGALMWNGTGWESTFAPFMFGSDIYSQAVLQTGEGEFTLYDNATLFTSEIPEGDGTPTFFLLSPYPISGVENSGQFLTIPGVDGSTNYVLWVVEFDMDVVRASLVNPRDYPITIVNGDSKRVPLNGINNVSMGLLNAGAEYITVFFPNYVASTNVELAAIFNISEDQADAAFPVFVPNLFLANGLGQDYTVDEDALPEGVTLSEGAEAFSLRFRGSTYELSVSYFDYSSTTYNDIPDADYDGIMWVDTVSISEFILPSVNPENRKVTASLITSLSTTYTTNLPEATSGEYELWNNKVHESLDSSDGDNSGSSTSIGFGVTE